MTNPVGCVCRLGENDFCKATDHNLLTCNKKSLNTVSANNSDERFMHGNAEYSSGGKKSIVEIIEKMLSDKDNPSQMKIFSKGENPQTTTVQFVIVYLSFKS